MAKSPLRALADIISNAVDHIDSQYAAENLSFPTLDVPFDPSHPSNALITHDLIVQQARVAVAAAEQLCALVRDPISVLLDIGLGYHKSSALGVAIDGNVPEILRDAGPQGLHVDEIVQKNGMDPNRLSRILRLLATYHVFTEVTPDAFANNRISLILDTEKPVSELSCPPRGSKYIGSNGVAAFFGLSTDEMLKCSAVMSEHLCDPKTRLSTVPSGAPLHRAFDTSDGYFMWIGQPGNEDRLARFHVGMTCLRNAEDIVTPDGFPWESLKAGSTIVDVGGGVGMVAVEIAKKFPNLKFIVQDLPSVSDQAIEFWKEQIPGSVESGKVVIQAHDFFKSQPVKDADIFVLRSIMHNWPTSHAIDILKRLREAAVPGKTGLLLVEAVLNYACKDLPEGIDEIQGIDKLVPSGHGELLSNLGRGGGWGNLLDMTMLVSLNGQERMIGEYAHVCEEAGWKITHVYCPGTPLHRQILAVPT